jgi:hypothetical protein
VAKREGFNPRTPAGCDLTSAKKDSSQVKFQPTHPCGVRLYMSLMPFTSVQKLCFVRTFFFCN